MAWNPNRRTPQPGDPDYSPYSAPPSPLGDPGQPNPPAEGDEIEQPNQPVPDAGASQSVSSPTPSSPPPTPGAAPAGPPPSDVVPSSAGSPASAPPSPTSLPPRAPQAGQGPSAPPMGPNQQAYMDQLQAGPPKSKWWQKALAGAEVVGAGLASSHQRTRPAAGEMSQIQSGVFNTLHPGYAQQMGRLATAAQQEQQQEEMGMKARQLDTENKRLDQQMGYQRAVLGQRESQQDMNASKSGVFTDNPKNPDPTRYVDNPVVRPDPSSGGAPRYYFAERPEWTAGMKAQAGQQAKEVPMTEADAAKFGIPTQALRRNSTGYVMVPPNVATEAVRQKLSPGNLTQNRQVMQTVIDKYASAEGKQPGGRLEDLSPESQIPAAREIMMQQPQATAIATGRDPNLVQQGLAAGVANKRTQTAATAQGAFMQPAPEPSAAPPPRVGGPVQPGGPKRQPKPAAPVTPTSGQTQPTSGSTQPPSNIPSNLIHQTSSGRSYIDGSALDARGKSAMIQRAGAQTPILDANDVKAVRAIDTTRMNNKAMMDQIQSLLPRDSANRVVDAPSNLLSQLFQTQDQLAAFKSWQESAFQQISALGGASGGRISNERIKIAINNLPKITDTVGTARQKITNITQMLDDGESVIWPGQAGGPAKPPAGIPQGARVQQSPSTGMYRYSTDGGKTWQVVSQSK